MTEHRTFKNVEIRALDETGPNGGPTVELQLVTPGVVDDYGSVWSHDVFDRAMSRRTASDPRDLPPLCWSHDWSDPIGHGIAYIPSTDPTRGPRMRYELDDFEAVPRAKQAYAQIKSGTMRDCSVGFSDCTRRPLDEDEETRWPGGREFMEHSDLDENSIVLRGAVPGAKVLSRTVRSAAGAVDLEAVVELAKKVGNKEITQEDAHRALDLLATPEGDHQPSEGSGDAMPPDPELDEAENMELPE